jgi:hypothetical protein
VVPGRSREKINMPESEIIAVVGSYAIYRIFRLT